MILSPFWRAPPETLYVLTPSIVTSCVRIERLLGRCEALAGSMLGHRRRRDVVRAAHATTAIDGNRLSLNEVAAVGEGQGVPCSGRDLREIKNALAAHELVHGLDAHAPVESLIVTRKVAYLEALPGTLGIGDATAFIGFMLAVIEESVLELSVELRSSRRDRALRPNAGARLDAAAAHFGETTFSRKQYLALHKEIAPATASRDLSDGIARGRLHGRGDRATAQYSFIVRT